MGQLARAQTYPTYLCIGSVDVSDGLTTNLKWDCFFHLSKSYHQKFFAFSVYLCTSFTVYVTVTTEPEPSHLLSHLKKKTFMAYSDKSSWHTFPSLGGRQPFTRHTWQKSCNKSLIIPPPFPPNNIAWSIWPFRNTRHRWYGGDTLNL